MATYANDAGQPLTFTVEIDAPSNDDVEDANGDFVLSGECGEAEEETVADAERNCAGIRSGARPRVKVEAGSETVTKDFDGLELMKATKLPKAEPSVSDHESAAEFVPGLIWIGAVKVAVRDETWRVSLSLDATSEAVWVSAFVDDTSKLRISLQPLPTTLSKE